MLWTCLTACHAHCDRLTCNLVHESDAATSARLSSPIALRTHSGLRQAGRGHGNSTCTGDVGILFDRHADHLRTRLDHISACRCLQVSTSSTLLAEVGDVVALGAAKTKTDQWRLSAAAQLGARAGRVSFAPCAAVPASPGAPHCIRTASGNASSAAVVRRSDATVHRAHSTASCSQAVAACCPRAGACAACSWRQQRLMQHCQNLQVG